MRRVSKFTAADLARALKAAQKAKLPIACVRIDRDGAILIVPGTPERVAVSSKLNDGPNDWD
jgi:hypothetical protein